MPIQEIRDGDRGDKLAVAIEIPVEAVGVDQVGQRLVAVLLVLVGILQRAKVKVDILGLNMADGDLAALDDEVGRADFGFRGVIDWGQVIAQRLKKIMQGGAIRMFAGNAGLVSVLNPGNEIG